MKKMCIFVVSVLFLVNSLLFFVIIFVEMIEIIVFFSEENVLFVLEEKILEILLVEE